jgi:phosphatidylglycerophosphatase A
MNNKFIIFLGSGGLAHKIPFLQGTFGTLEAAIIYLIISKVAPGRIQLFCYSLIVFFATMTLILGDKYEEHLMKKDPPSFVLDEMAGFFCSIIFLPISYLYLILAFVMFRIFDIWKPLLISRVQKIPGGLGILADDLLAGFCANICCQIIRITI